MAVMSQLAHNSTALHVQLAVFFLALKRPGRHGKCEGKPEMETWEDVVTNMVCWMRQACLFLKHHASTWDRFGQGLILEDSIRNGGHLLVLVACRNRFSVTPNMQIDTNAARKRSDLDNLDHQYASHLCTCCTKYMKHCSNPIFRLRSGTFIRRSFRDG